jgi:hypothetical protein
MDGRTHKIDRILDVRETLSKNKLEDMREESGQEASETSCQKSENSTQGEPENQWKDEPIALVARESQVRLQKPKIYLEMRYCP